jgi:FKBP-type peptidyl-prolyl cis-trans isomerase FkpA
MTTWKRLSLLLLPILIGAACASAPSSDDAANQVEYHQPPKNAFEESFSHEDGVRPIRWGGWLKTLTPGTGAGPSTDSTVTVNYRGTLIDGTEFDSSYKRGQPSTFPLSNVIPCWTNGVPMMKVGEKAKFVCPSSAGYGDRGSPPLIPGGATLVFEIELVGIVR